MRSPPQRQQVSVSKSLPAPIGGLNARDAIANMDPNDAIMLDNWFVQPSWVETRLGYSVLGTFTGNCQTLMAYGNIAGTNQLFAAVNNSGTRSIYRVDNLAGGAVGAPVVGGGGATIEALTSTYFDWAQFGTGSAEVLYLVNGSDNPLIYDGTVWQAVTGVSAPYAITGVTTSTLSAVATYKQRLWFLQKNTMNVWYLAQNSIAGAATQLNLAPNFTLGGQLVTIITVSIDNSSGTQDYIAFVTNQGEVAVFTGYDPASANTWSLAAKFRIGRPVGFGRRCWQKMGSDAVMIGADGFILMSQALLTDRSQTKEAVSDKIRYAVTSDVTNYANNVGWQVILYPLGNKLIVNVPTTTDSSSYQYVMNTLCSQNGGWSTWNKVNNGYNAFCWENMGDGLYFGSNGFVAQQDAVEIDGLKSIICSATQAYNYFDDPGSLKHFKQARCIFVADGSMQVAITMGIDFGTPPSAAVIPLHTGTSTFWGSAWGSFWGGSEVLSKRWVGVYGIGYAGALSCYTMMKNAQGQWQGSTIMYEKGGPFG